MVLNTESNRLIDLRKSLLEAFAVWFEETQELKTSLETMSLPVVPNDYAGLVCRRVAETHALKAYLSLQNEFFDLLKISAPQATKSDEKLSSYMSRETAMVWAHVLARLPPNLKC
jgi:hypothetical protein